MDYLWTPWRYAYVTGAGRRSEKRRVGEEGRSRGAPDHLKKKKKKTIETPKDSVNLNKRPNVARHKRLGCRLSETRRRYPFRTDTTVLVERLGVHVQNTALT